MSVFDADELADLRAEVEATLEDTCTRRRYADGALDERGNPTQGAADEVEYACRLVPAPGSEDTVDRDVQTHDASFLLPHDADVIGGDILEHDEITWEVIGPAVTQSWPTHLRVIVRRSETL